MGGGDLRPIHLLPDHGAQDAFLREVTQEEQMIAGIMFILVE